MLDFGQGTHIDALIGPRTVNTVPMETLDAYRDHGDPAPRLTKDVAQARQVLEKLNQLGIDIDAVTEQLEDEGVEKFAVSYDRVLEALGQKQPVAA